MKLLHHVPLSALRIEDESDFEEVPLYARLKQVLLNDDVTYRVPAAGSPLGRWDPVLLLNLGFWTPGEPDDVLEGRDLTADVVAHRAWHHLAHKALGEASSSVEGLMLGEAIASAFDVYMLGSLLRTCPGAAMLETQLPAMMDVAVSAGCTEDQVNVMFESFAHAPQAAFQHLVTLIYETGVALCKSDGAEAAAAVLVEADERPLAEFLHHFQFSSWVLYAKAYARSADGSVSSSAGGQEAAAMAAKLLGAADPLDALTKQWL